MESLSYRCNYAYVGKYCDAIANILRERLTDDAAAMGSKIFNRERGPKNNKSETRTIQIFHAFHPSNRSHVLSQKTVFNLVKSFIWCCSKPHN